MGFQDQLLLNAGQKYCRMLQGSISAILSTCIKLPHGFKAVVWCVFLSGRLRQVSLYPKKMLSAYHFDNPKSIPENFPYLSNACTCIQHKMNEYTRKKAVLKLT